MLQAYCLPDACLFLFSTKGIFSIEVKKQKMKCVPLIAEVSNSLFSKSRLKLVASAS